MWWDFVIGMISRKMIPILLSLILAGAGFGGIQQWRIQGKDKRITELQETVDQCEQELSDALLSLHLDNEQVKLTQEYIKKLQKEGREILNDKFDAHSLSELNDLLRSKTEKNSVPPVR